MNLCCLFIFLSQLLCIGSAIHCPAIPRMPYASLETSDSPPLRTGAVAKFVCDKGFRAYGKAKLTCDDKGRWDGVLPSCRAYKCRRVTEKVESRRKCRKPCKHDGNCKGALERCMCDDWCGKSCLDPSEKCKALSSPTNGYLIGRGRSYGDAVMYGCNDGYILVGSSFRMCRSDKKWSGYTPSCVTFSICGLSKVVANMTLSGKVVAGTDAKKGAWPWQALMINNYRHSSSQIYNIKAGFGGGSIISERWILSAAHVFDQFHSSRLSGNWKEDFLIVVGMTAYPHFGQDVPEHVHIFEPREVRYHPKYDEYSFDYDVALVRVGRRLVPGPNKKFELDYRFPEERLMLSRFIRPICLPCVKGLPIDSADILKKFDKKVCSSSDLTTPQSDVIVTGFGRIANPGGGVAVNPRNLQEGNLKILKDNECIESVKEISNSARFTDRMLCASSKDTKLKTDSCQGDSGGPLVKMIEDKKRGTYWVQVGIVSWGAEKCGGELPGFYTQVSSIMPWVNEIIKGSEPARSCPPPSLNNGNANSTSNLAGSIVRYSCNSGYKLVGREDGLCQDNGSWGVLPTCNIKSCVPPPRLKNGIAEANNHTYGSIVKYSCYLGYVLQGNKEGLCGADETWGPEPTCQARSCLPPSLNNGKANATSNLTGSIVRYSCNSGYKLVGHEDGFCQDDGTWGVLPICKIKSCLPPPTLKNGIVEANNHTYGSIVKYSCNPGYILQGNNEGLCGADETWGPVPTCQARFCPPLFLNNGNANASSNLTGSIVRYSCKSGYNLVGREEGFCQDDGTWGVLPTCNIKSCPHPPPLKNGIAEANNLTYGSIVRYSCNPGYILKGKNKGLCAANETWGPEPTCQEKLCPPPPPPENGVAVAKSRTYGSVVKYSCNPGYKIKGNEKGLCAVDGTWGAFPKCKIKSCPRPLALKNGVAIAKSRTYGSAVKYSCDHGYKLKGKEKGFCAADGTWGALPKCKSICPQKNNAAERCNITCRTDRDCISMEGLCVCIKNCGMTCIEPGFGYPRSFVSSVNTSIIMGGNNNVEVYFLIDLSVSVKAYALRDVIDFAIGLINRLSTNDPNDQVSYGIVVFATSAVEKLDILDDPKKTSKEVIHILNEIYADAGRIRRKIGYHTNIEAALMKLDRMLSLSYDMDDKTMVKRHIVALTDGALNITSRPSDMRRSIEAAYRENQPNV